MAGKQKRLLSLLFIAVIAVSSWALVACSGGSSKKTTKKTTQKKKVKQYIKTATVVDQKTVKIGFRLYLDKKLEAKTNWKISPDAEIASVKNKKRWGKRSATYIVSLKKPLKMGVNYKISVGKKYGPKPLQLGNLLNAFYSKKPMGMTHKGNELVFRVFAPRGEKVKLALFKKGALDKPYKEYDMKRDGDGVWEYTLKNAKDYMNQLYGYRVFGPEGDKNYNSKEWVADPYGKANAQDNTFPMRSRTVILPQSYKSEYSWDKGVDKWTGLKSRDAVIYEVHVRDMTMHPSSGVKDELKGTYEGFIEKIPYLKSIGVNAVELMPVHDIGNVEPPFQKSVKMPDGDNWIKNTWNSYAYNHWGYMTASFFAVESSYARGWTKDPKKWNGADGKQLLEFKKLVEALHKAGISVILDVVYNHVSQYDYNSYKLIDHDYYFRKTSKSGCGNDFKTERPMARRVILDSLKYYMDELHVDGFRFDLMGLIDDGTKKAIAKECKELNSDVLLIAEPWGGEYCPTKVSKMGMQTWNDKFRNGIKGSDSNASGNGGSFIYGKSTAAWIKKHVYGGIKSKGGHLHKIEHSINYVAGHDNHSLGDHIRITTGKVGKKEEVKKEDIPRVAKLNKREMEINKLAALMLYTSQGGLMILEGQEWAQPKVTFPPEQKYDDYGDTHPWTLDHNSYEKDNETNWLNYEFMKLNKELVDYYAGLAKVRAKYKALRWSQPSDFKWLTGSTGKAIGWVLQGKVVVLANSHKSQKSTFTLPDGKWKVLVNKKDAGLKTLDAKSGKVTLPAASGMVLVQ